MVLSLSSRDIATMIRLVEEMKAEIALFRQQSQEREKAWVHKLELLKLDQIVVHVRRLFGCSSQGVNDEILADIHNLFDENQDKVTSNTLGPQLGDSNSTRKVTVKGAQQVFDEMPERNLSWESKVKPIFEETWDSVTSGLFVLRQDGEVMEAYHLFQKLPATNWCCGSKELVSGWVLELKVFSLTILFGSNSYIHNSIFCCDLGLRYHGLIAWRTGIGTNCMILEFLVLGEKLTTEFNYCEIVMVDRSFELELKVVWVIEIVAHYITFHENSDVQGYVYVGFMVTWTVGNLKWPTGNGTWVGYQFGGSDWKNKVTDKGAHQLFDEIPTRNSEVHNNVMRGLEISINVNPDSSDWMLEIEVLSIIIPHEFHFSILSDIGWYSYYETLVKWVVCILKWLTGIGTHLSYYRVNEREVVGSTKIGTYIEFGKIENFSAKVTSGGCKSEDKNDVYMNFQLKDSVFILHWMHEFEFFGINNVFELPMTLEKDAKVLNSGDNELFDLRIHEDNVEMPYLSYFSCCKYDSVEVIFPWIFGFISWRTGIGTYIQFKLMGYWCSSIESRVLRYISNGSIAEILDNNILGIKCNMIQGCEWVWDFNYDPNGWRLRLEQLVEKLGSNNCGGLMFHGIIIVPSETIISSMDENRRKGLEQSTQGTYMVSNKDKYDVVIANILLNPLLNLADHIVSYVKPGAVVGFCVILSEQLLGAILTSHMLFSINTANVQTYKFPWDPGIWCKRIYKLILHYFFEILLQHQPWDPGIQCYDFTTLRTRLISTGWQWNDYKRPKQGSSPCSLKPSPCLDNILLIGKCSSGMFC